MVPADVIGEFATEKIVVGIVSPTDVTTADGALQLSMLPEVSVKQA